MNRIEALLVATLAWATLAGGACTTTYTQAELDAKEPLSEPVPTQPNCTGSDDEPGCEMEDPICIDPGDFRCLPPDA